MESTWQRMNANVQIIFVLFSQSLLIKNNFTLNQLRPVEQNGIGCTVCHGFCCYFDCSKWQTPPPLSPFRCTYHFIRFHKLPSARIHLKCTNASENGFVLSLCRDHILKTIANVNVNVLRCILFRPWISTEWLSWEARWTVSLLQMMWS